jgi:hypothetical protein
MIRPGKYYPSCLSERAPRPKNLLDTRTYAIFRSPQDDKIAGRRALSVLYQIALIELIPVLVGATRWVALLGEYLSAPLKKKRLNYLYERILVLAAMCRNNSGAFTKYPANKEACRRKLPGFRRHRGGIFRGQNYFGATAGRSNVSSSPKKGLIFALVPWAPLVNSVFSLA